MAAVDAQSLVTDANPLQAIGPQTALLIQIYLLQQIAGGSVATMTAQQLVTAVNSYQMIRSQALAENIIIYLLGQILNGGGGGSAGGGVTAGNYGGGQPNFTPASGAAIAIDTSNSREWTYYNGAWH